MFRVVGEHVILDLTVCDSYMGEKDQGSLISKAQSLVLLLLQEDFGNIV